MALFLRGRGYRAFAMLGGFNAWRDAGLPLLPLQVPAGGGRPDRDRPDAPDHREPRSGRHDPVADPS